MDVCKVVTSKDTDRESKLNELMNEINPLVPEMTCAVA
jgi:hypothetical protein